MNSITITGNLGKDGEPRELGDGTPVLSFSVADSQGREKPTIWWNCSIFGRRAESLGQYLTKGQQVTVIGNVSEREWTDRDGNKRKSMDIRVQDIALQGKRESHAASKTAATGSGFDDMDDDIPF
jgi:single-strand DNA-binding protein